MNRSERRILNIERDRSVHRALAHTRALTHWKRRGRYDPRPLLRDFFYIFPRPRHT